MSAIDTGLRWSCDSSFYVDDIVIYKNKLYKCTIDHSGDWNSGDFKETTIAQLLS